ncbi:hypothetical protein FOXB_17249 [Fusarium oxysporum f. sp. conglutinans Fo5176]|uniref:P-type ATPase A domain-containing protein n=1 Tax=Fusarium oxysporum (strain Fo5176) TaxID=660025 RepID=F9GF15_FUSOF|nr:hypothetical protein FOXB_17249 [Fusarium oxysporum f. sp. conglutinans Fo5176]
MALLAVITNQDDGGKRCAGLDVPRGYGMKRRISIPQVMPTMAGLFRLGLTTWMPWTALRTDWAGAKTLLEFIFPPGTIRQQFQNPDEKWPFRDSWGRCGRYWHTGRDSLQEFQAAKTTDSLRSLSSPTADAVRGGNNETVVTVEIVPGDMVELNIGDTIPVDIRLVEAVNFEANEALLASEPLPGLSFMCLRGAQLLAEMESAIQDVERGLSQRKLLLAMAFHVQLLELVSKAWKVDKRVILIARNCPAARKRVYEIGFSPRKP